MDISSLIGPSSGGSDEAKASPQTFTPGPLQRAQSIPESPVPMQMSRRQTVSSLLNDDESDYLQSRIGAERDRSIDLGRADQSPAPLPRSGSLPMESTTSPLVHSRSQSLQSPTEARIELETNPNGQQPIEPSPVFRSTQARTHETTEHTSQFIKQIELIKPLSPLSTANHEIGRRDSLPPPPRRSSVISEEGSSSVHSRRESRDSTDIHVGHLPPKPGRRRSSGVSNSSSHSSHEPVLPSSLPPPPKTQSISSPVLRRNSRSKSNGELKPPSTTQHIGETPVSAQKVPTTAKPKRYETPPIWAQSYRMLKKMPRIFTRNPNYRNGNQGQTSHIPTTSQIASTSGLPVSLTDVLPFEELTRKVTEWLFATLHQLGDDRKYAEVEIKLGRIMQKENDSRLSMPVITETVVRPDYARNLTYFVPSVSDRQFDGAVHFLDSLAKESKANPGKPTDIRADPSKHTTDVTYNIIDNVDNVRVTLNEDDEVLERIIKRRVDNLDVHSPGDLLDFRVTVSLEIPQSESEYNMLKLSKNGQRVKNRLSYRHRAFQADLTLVTNNQKVATRELELEMNQELLLKYYHGLERGDKDASIEFEELVRFLIDNARLILRKVSRP